MLSFAELIEHFNKLSTKLGCFVLKHDSRGYYLWEMYSSEKFYFNNLTSLDLERLLPLRVGDSFCAVYNPYNEVCFFKEFISFKEFLKRLYREGGEF